VLFNPDIDELRRLIPNPILKTGIHKEGVISTGQVWKVDIGIICQYDIIIEIPHQISVKNIILSLKAYAFKINTDIVLMVLQDIIILECGVTIVDPYPCDINGRRYISILDLIGIEGDQSLVGTQPDKVFV
jgi:hypothetical protein